MKKIVGITLGALAIAVFANTASAQLGYTPVLVYPSGYAGLNIQGGIGMGLNSDAEGADGKIFTYGGMVGFGGGMFNINAGVNQVDPKTDGVKKPLSFGGNVQVTVMKPAESPLAINVFGGFGMWNLKTDTDPSQDIVKVMNIPFGVGIGFSPPTAGSVGFEVWAAPRGNYLSEDYDGDKVNRFGFGASGGVNVNFAAGFGVYAAIDWSTFSEKTVDAGIAPKVSPLVWGAGLKYTFGMPGM
jgi:opacity protein-like surface antigen